MKKILLATATILFLVGCETISVSSLPDKPREAGNDGRIQQYLEENILDSENGICNFDLLNQPNGNVVEVWTLCEEFFALESGDLDKGQTMSLPVKITFANPSLHVIPAGGEGYIDSIKENFSEIAIEKIFEEEVRNIQELETRNLTRAKKWLQSAEKQIEEVLIESMEHPENVVEVE